MTKHFRFKISDCRWVCAALCAAVLTAAAVPTRFEAIQIGTNIFSATTNGVLLLNGAPLSSSGGGKANAAGTNDSISIFSGSTNANFTVQKSPWDWTLNDFSNMVSQAGIASGGGGVANPLTANLDLGGYAITGTGNTFPQYSASTASGATLGFQFNNANGEGSGGWSQFQFANTNGQYFVCAYSPSTDGEAIVGVYGGGPIILGAGGGVKLRSGNYSDDGATRVHIDSTGAIFFPALPRTDPVNAGQLWNNGGVLSISVGY